MSTEKIQEFLCTWKITNFNIFLGQKKDKFIPSPIFRMENFDDSKWTLSIHPKGFSEKHRENTVCRLRLIKCGEYYNKIPITFRFELLSPKGYILKSYEILNETMQDLKFSEPCALINIEELKQVMSSWSVDTLTIRCHFKSKNDLMPLTSNQSSATGCDVETKIHGQDSSFTWVFGISELEEWSANKHINISNFPIEVTFKLIKNEIKIYLFSDVEDESENRVICGITLIDEKDNDLVSAEGYHFFKNTSKIWTFPSFLFKCHLVKANCFLLKEIKLKCKLSYTFSNKVLTYAGKNNVEIVKHDFAIDESQRHPSDLFLKGYSSKKFDQDGFLYLIQDLRSMLFNGKFVDVKLRVHSELFPAHKNVLATRSPVFSAMFDQDMVETNTGIVEILDVEPSIMKSFLEYIYTSEVDEMNEDTAMSLLIVADKYQVLPLVTKCTTHLESSLSLKNVCRVFSTADMVNQDHLKSVAEEYILSNPTSILSSPDWSDLIKGNVTLVTELLFKISKRMETTMAENKE